MAIPFKRLFTILITIAAVLQGCSETTIDCSTVLCVGDSPIRLELIENGTNLLADPTYTEADFSISGDVGTEVTIFLSRGLQGNTEALLEISDSSWQPGNGTFSLSLPGDRSIDFSTVFGETTGECCGGALTVEQLQSQQVPVSSNAGYFTLTLD
ncbi:hypothetical protein SAMN04490243_1590 [Robiginitalea myxolifaciens]|uniref:Uncharacterized protein n=1 Tax=Robiginitalea myxolifaciens TaxID=400055 RepID=A0A1I6GCQ8_9FLAO|nr:hypothetical protein [Robiginitalea myxolifaciens]SFR39975.1 hypothetical protein SAMN04490243_1590 [Robiginitalea myxolifaciens]